MPTKRKTSSPTRRPADAPQLPRLGYLLKQAHLQFIEQANAALIPLGMNTRVWAALMSLDDEQGSSQAEIAQRLGIDRTTMVALIDELQARGLVAREMHPNDRRKNRIGLTREGSKFLQQGMLLVDDTERRFLAVLGKQKAQQLKKALQAVIKPNSKT